MAKGTFRLEQASLKAKRVKIRLRLRILLSKIIILYALLKIHIPTSVKNNDLKKYF